MLDLHIPPFITQMFRDQPAMTVMRFVFTAQKATAIEQARLNGLDLAIRDQRSKIALVGGPIAIEFLVAIEHLFRRCQVHQMHILDSSDGSQKVRQIIPFGEPGQLRVVVEPRIDDPLDACALQPGEKSLGCLLGEADGEEVDGVHVTLSSGRASRYSIRSACQS